MLARLSPDELESKVVPLEPWQLRLRPALARWEAKQARKAANAKAKPRRINKDRRRHLVETVATIMKRGMEEGQPSKFAFEGHLRHALRSGLCLKGWQWAEADAVAADIVAAALNQIGARRPTWKEGQPEHVQFGVVMFERTRCVTCGWKLPEGHKLYCSSICYVANQSERRSKWDNAYDKAVRYAAKWKTRRAADET